MAGLVPATHADPISDRLLEACAPLRTSVARRGVGGRTTPAMAVRKDQCRNVRLLPPRIRPYEDPATLTLTYPLP